ENYDPTVPGSFRLDFRPLGTLGWIPLDTKNLTKQAFWPVETNGQIEVRLRARDRAENEGSTIIKVTPGADPGPAQGHAKEKEQAPQGGGGTPADPNRRLLNSTTISLNFEIKDKGPSGISAIELWFTQDGRSWNKYPLPKPPDGLEVQSPLTFKVNNEGV